METSEADRDQEKQPTDENQQKLQQPPGTKLTISLQHLKDQQAALNPMR